jgi:hypothetical protein
MYKTIMMPKKRLKEWKKSWKRRTKKFWAIKNPTSKPEENLNKLRRAMSRTWTKFRKSWWEDTPKSKEKLRILGITRRENAWSAMKNLNLTKSERYFHATMILSTITALRNGLKILRRKHALFAI